LKPWTSEQGKAAFYRQIAQADVKFTDDFQDKLSQATCPALILWGEEDQWIPVSQAYSLHNKMKGSTLVTIPNTGHLVIEEAPSRLVSEILAFFSQ